MLNHIWIIMDWNRRWAKQKLLPSFIWHKTWWENIQKVVDIAVNNSVKYLTLWALSTENIKNRTPEELEYIFNLLLKIWDYFRNFVLNWIKFDYIWDKSLLPENVIIELEKLKEKTKDNSKLTLTLAIWYGWKDEIIRWIKDFINSWESLENLTEESFWNFLDTKNLPEVDLIIRTGWDIRTSGYLLYKTSYSEYYFTKKLWPDFDEDEFNNAVKFFQNSKRNFWK